MSTPQPTPIDIAHRWLKKRMEECGGLMSTWTPEEMDRYHRDLGLLVDFVTDCWPSSDQPKANNED